MRRGVGAFLVAVLMLVALPARADDVASAINNARGSGLTIDGTVDSFAEAAAQRIAANQSLVHSDVGSLLGPCTAAGEVIGYGPDVTSVMDAFAASPGHRSTINQSKWNAMGTGLAVDSGGVLWIAVVFCTLASTPAPAPAPAPAAAPVAPAPAVAQPQAPLPRAPATPVLQIIGPFITTDGIVSQVIGASPFLPEEDWRVFPFPSIN